jgi:hypothetical protein
MSKSSKYVIWLKNLDSYVEEGSGKPSLFDTERAATKCAKALWPKDAWVVRPFSYIKRAEKRQEKEERVYQQEISSKVTAGGFQHKFKPPTASKPFCIFLFEKPKERKAPDHSSRTLTAARKWAKTAAKKFINKSYPDREIHVLDCASEDFPQWVDSIIGLPEDLVTEVEGEARPIGTETTENLTQPSPRRNADGLWVCPITDKTYQTLSKYMFTNIIKAATETPDLYVPIMEWKAFTYGEGWICPYTGKIFKRKGKYLDNHLIKQRKLLEGS